MDASSEYTETGFWEKVKNQARIAGHEVIEKALWLHYAAQRPETPTWAKATMYGALAYLISPLDAIPDVTPIVGYADDLGAIAAAIGMVSAHINAEVRLKATEKLKDWFD